MKSLAEVFDAATVGRLAGPAAYSRGDAYLRDGRLESGDVGDGRLEATVRGTMPYFVELWADRDRPRWSCTCPAAEDGSFCKHCVVAALSLGPDDDPSMLVPFAGSGRSADGVAGGPGAGPAAGDELADFVAGLAPERLVEIVLERAASDWRLRERLVAEARAASGADPDLARWRRRIDRAFAAEGHVAHGFVTYGEAPGWAAGIDDVIDALDDLCDAGHHDAATRLAEHAHRRADKSMEYVDDSDGWLSGFSGRLSELHLRACEAGSPDPVELAARLVELELTSELDGFHRCAAAYADVLGEEGLAAFRAGLEPHGKRTGHETGAWSGRTFAARQAMVGWALGTGDPDTLIEVQGRRGVHPDSVLEIVWALDRAGRGDEAIAWARRGLNKWDDRPWQVRDLREFLAAKLRGRGEEKAAVELYWRAFVSEPSLTAYRRLHDEDGAQDWLRRCREALVGALAGAPRAEAGPEALGAVDGNDVAAVAAAARAETAPEALGAAFGPLPPPVPQAAAALVDILLFEGIVDAAWDAAHDYGCRAQVWMTLARAREKPCPLEAIAVYECAALAIIDRKQAKQYQSAVDLMGRIRRLAGAAGEPDRFESLLGRVRTEHRAKRKLKALLDAQGW